MRRAIQRGEERVGSFRRQLDAYRTENVGMLGIPVAAYLELFDSITRPSQKAIKESVAEATFPVLAAYTSAVRRARADHYHWSRLATPFHPVEPDILGIFLAMNRALRTRDVSLTPILTAMPISHDALELLRGTLRQYDSWGDDGEPLAR